MSSVLLTACGGGEGGRGDGDLGGTSISSGSYVTGLFKDASASHLNHLLLS